MNVNIAKAGCILAGTASFVVALMGTYVVHARFFSVDVVLYSAIQDVLIAAGACSILLWRLAWFKALGVVEKMQLTAIWLLTGYALAISVPTVIDRSLSFYILEKIEQRGGGIRQDAFEAVFSTEYVKEHRLVDVRLTEQLESGTITIHDGCVVLTSKGRQVAAFSRMFRKTFLPKHRLLMGSYSDDLTDPFRNSRQDVNYQCHE